MNSKRLRLILGIAVVAALVVSLLPMTYSTAMENAQDGSLQCPPMDASKSKDPGFLRSLPAQCRAQLHKVSSPQQGIFSESLLLSSGGPDGFGYTYDDTVPVNWISPSAPGLTGDEGYIGPYGLGFMFPFYGVNYSGFYINFNGLLTFNSGECCSWGGTPIPSTDLPNNLIAPFWEDLAIGAPFNSGGLFYETGGVTPDRYFVAEWRDVTTYSGSDPFSFEVILYENGDIVFQYQSLPASYFSTVGIEDGTGQDGLGYQSGNSGLSAPKAVKFIYPTGPIPRVSVSPLNTGKFASTNANANFPVTILNNGSAGTDTYNLSLTSAWSANLYQDGCVTPLTDTNADTVIDTGALPEGSSTTICVSYQTPIGAGIGDSNSGVLSVSSSLDPARTRDASMSMVIPTSFIQVFRESGAGMAFQLNGPEGPVTNYLTDDLDYRDWPAILRMPDGRYIYAWNRNVGFYDNIEFALLNADGTFDLPVTQLTNNAGTGQTYDFSPAVAVTANGNIGITWLRLIVDSNTGLPNFNVYFAVLDDTGALLSGPSNLTNNDLYDNYDNLDVPHFFRPVIAGTDDNRFVLSWEDYRTDGISTFSYNVWYTTHDSNGASILAPVALTNDGRSFSPILNPLSGSNVILTWVSYVISPAFQIHANYAVLAGSGAIVKDATPIDSGALSEPSSDAVLLPNGNTAIALGQDDEVALAILDPSYDIVAPLTVAATASPFNPYMSVTYDSSNNIVMTWLDGGDERNSYYALADSTGAFISSPIIMRSNDFPATMILSVNGQGNAPILETEPPGLDVDIDILPGRFPNIVSPKMSFVSVAILSADGFDAVSDVDRSSLTFGKTGNEASLFMCLSKASDVNGDGRHDLVCLFRFSMTGIVSGDTQGTLKGQALAGAEFEATDSLRVSPIPTK